MKIFTDTQIKELDQYTIEHEPIAGIDLMERAAKALTQAIVEEWTTQTPFVVFAGPGNNGGDALAVARMLAEKGYQVSVYLFNIQSNLSEECAENKERIIDCKKIANFVEVHDNFDPPQLTENVVVIDGLFGAGLSKPLYGGFSALVKYINQSPCKVVSIDMPSGLLKEDNTYNVSVHIIQADLTLTLQLPKLSMLFADTQRYLGRLRILDIQLSADYIENVKTLFNIVEEQDIRRLLISREDFAHKGSMGHALLMAGSYGMSGAAVLAAKACMRSGVGKLTVSTPRCSYNVMQTALPEAVLKLDDKEAYISEALDAEGLDAIGIGPGIGQKEETGVAMISQIKRARCPIVLDADALNILGTHRSWLQQLPKNTILTPHPKEFDRLDGTVGDGAYDRLMKACKMAKHLQVYIILKGHYSALCMPDGKVFFNPTGNSGMATAGSGDVLTGIITALLARGYSRENACLVGMYLHGLAGDMAAEVKGKESLIASDIIQYLPAAFQYLNS